MTNKRAQWLTFLKAINQEAGFGPLRELRNEEGNLHSDLKPAYRSRSKVCWYRNGRKHGTDTDIYGSISYFFNGVMIPPVFHREPESLTIEQILGHPNTEVRRIGIEIYGLDRLEEEEKFKILDTDDKDQQLLQMELPDLQPATFVKVFNGTPEIDGTYRTYFLSVPPTMTSVKEAVAWTFQLESKEYQPQVET